MGFLDKLKKAMGGSSEPKSETVKGPSMHLREKGIDPEGLKFAFGSGGSLTVSGEISDEAFRGPIISALEGMPQISSVIDEIQLAVATPEPEPEPEPEPAQPEPVAAGDNGSEAAGDNGSDAGEGRTYTVQSGDTLWKIAKETLGNGSKYMKIFEANTDLLENPDKIFPGQVLKIPELDD